MSSNMFSCYFKTAEIKGEGNSCWFIFYFFTQERFLPLLNWTTESGQPLIVFLARTYETRDPYDAKPVLRELEEVQY